MCKVLAIFNRPPSWTRRARETCRNNQQPTIVASVACVSVLLPAAAEFRRVLDEQHNPTRLLKVATRRSQVEHKG